MLQALDAYIDIDEAKAVKFNSSIHALSGSFTFRSSVKIRGSAIFIPEQNFSLRFSASKMEIESQPSKGWPKIFLGFITNDEGIYQIKKVRIEDSELSTDSKVNSTRLRFAIAERKNFSIDIPKIGQLPIKFSVSQKWINDNKELAKIFRKLRFIEFVFNVKFNIPAQLNPIDMRGIEYLYRGLTEGEFVTREVSVKLQISKTQIDWSKPPFNLSGVFPQMEKWYTADFFGGMEDLLERRLLVGPASIRLEKASYAGQEIIASNDGNSEDSILISFDVLDHQIFVRYDKYANKGKKKLQEKLAQFKYECLRDDPPELLALMDELLIPDVNEEEANLIAMGWIQYNRLPDRYCPQDPEFDEVKKLWRVPLCLVYANGQGEQVGELFIDAKSGRVLESPQLLEKKNNLQIDMDQAQGLSNFDQQVVTAARRFMDRHSDLLTRLAK